MEEFTIRGVVAEGCGKFRREIGLPADLLAGHEGWMARFEQGTLNVNFPIAHLPSTLCRNGLRSLDLNPDFKPHIYRNGTDVLNNTIKPTQSEPRRGDVQLWRAVLVNVDLETEVRCFLIRRVGSGYRDRAEILGQTLFRRELGFENGHQIEVTVHADCHET